jgi:hypothetical protein
LTGSTITGYGYGGSGTAKAEYGATGGAGGPGLVVIEWS